LRRVSMISVRSLFGVLLVAGTAFGQLPIERQREVGTSVTGAFEGWFKNPDGTFSLLLGYYNRNLKQELDIPVGTDNKIEPGGPDRGQPTHFVPGRGWGVFTVRVPADFGDGKLTWTLTANGKATSIPAHLKAEYEISPMKEFSVGNTPPVVSFREDGPTNQGPQFERVLAEYKTRAGTALPITVWATDDEKPVSNSSSKPRPGTPPVAVRWMIYRGPGPVAFSEERPALQRLESRANYYGKATTTVTFSEPGEYTLQVVANDYSGEGGAGFQCCWTNAQARVVVEPK
jgi:hypothetical protein